ncbi:Cof-type HAD-IIB family hydrolase [Lihuaxuella thermophila]|uniref:Phosphoglycolate phosphatase n=1 Tax=Lihuaxuella thermophila TaxID=1173111 RepID=A0A1H8CGE1_9BACL|nr:Cof-type HAD-IIB family hydrolase [Lihuaxuella thermophila]SEM94032.1 hypothetical protein SAMN05444955_103281 [Lihuaxuella thermophila]
MKEIKLIALDMDGTLLDNHGNISPANRQAIKEAQEKGISVVFSTGRTMMTCRDYAESLQLSSYLVTVNGAEIWTGSGELLERNLIEADLVRWMWELSQKYSTYFWCVTIDQVWRNDIPADILAHQWLKFGFDTDDQAAREKILQELETERDRVEITNSSPTNIEVNAKGVNKAQGLKSVCRRIGISMENVMALGDSLNDLAMIKEAGLGVAMGNAQPVVKEAADWITATNQEDGVAQAIRHWVL